MLVLLILLITRTSNSLLFDHGTTTYYGEEQVVGSQIIRRALRATIHASCLQMETQLPSTVVNTNGNWWDQTLDYYALYAKSLSHRTFGYRRVEAGHTRLTVSSLLDAPYVLWPIFEWK